MFDSPGFTEEAGTLISAPQVSRRGDMHLLRSLFVINELEIVQAHESYVFPSLLYDVSKSLFQSESPLHALETSA